MTAHQEIELKLRVDPDRLPAFRKSEWWRGLGRGRRKSLHSIYFDTPDQRLRDENIVLRIRLDGPNVIQTVKMGVEDSNAIVRREWEAIVPDAVPDPSLVIDPVLPPSFRRLSSLDVEPVFEMKITRDIRKLSVEDTAVEVVVDTGTVTSGDRSAQINEIEMELLSGDAAKLFSVARDINETVPTRLHLKTKSDVGFSLADGKRTTWLKAKTPTLDASMTAGSALDAIVFSCLRHLTANDTCARARLHDEGVHQSRIALRRLHSAFKIYEKALPDQALVNLSDETRWLAKEMGPARDLDVLQAELLAPMLDVLDDTEGVVRLMDKAKSLEDDAYADVAEALSSRRYGNLLIDLCAFGLDRELVLAGNAEDYPALSMPAVDFARNALSALHKRVLKRGKKFEKLSVADRHRVRIAVKKMRYGVEFFGDLFPGKAQKKYSKRMARLQDDLGRLNDVAMAEGMIDKLASGESADLDRDTIVAAGRVLGWHQRRMLENDGKLVEDWYAFAETKPFWVD